MTLPPGQRPIDGFPRFGTHLSRPAPDVPSDPVIAIRGAVSEAFHLPLAILATLPRRELSADFHCVAGWSATDLHWEGVSFETLYRSVIEPALPNATSVTHVLFRGLDGYASVVLLEDARRRRADRGAPRRPPARQHPWRADPVGQPQSVRLCEYQAPVPYRGPHLRTGGPGAVGHPRDPAPVGSPPPGEGVARGAARPPTGVVGSAHLPGLDWPHEVSQQPGQPS